MKNLIKISVGMALVAFVACTNTGAQTGKETKTVISMDNDVDKMSYSLGMNLAQQVKANGLENINKEALIQGINDVYGGEALQIESQEAIKIINEFFQKKQSAKAEVLIKPGQDFLAENKKKDGVVELPSGLQYKIIKEGTGEKPTASSTVKTHYHGTLIDGTVFDSSVDRGEPISFGVNRVIKGWTEALQLMPVGSKWELYIPYNLAYGPKGSGAIAPYAALIFQVELLGIEG